MCEENRQTGSSFLPVRHSINTDNLTFLLVLSVCLFVVLSVCSWIVKHYNRTVYMFVFVITFVILSMCVCTVACLPCTVNTDNLFVMCLSVSIIQTIWLFFYWSCLIVKNYDRTVLYVFNCLLGVFCHSILVNIDNLTFYWSCLSVCCRIVNSSFSSNSVIWLIWPIFSLSFFYWSFCLCNCLVCLLSTLLAQALIYRYLVMYFGFILSIYLCYQLRAPCPSF